MENQKSKSEIYVLLVLLGNFICGCLVVLAGLFSDNMLHLSFGCYIALASTVAAYFIEEK